MFQLQNTALDDKCLVHMLVLYLVESCNNVYSARSTLGQRKNLHSRPSRTTEKLFCDKVNWYRKSVTLSLKLNCIPNPKDWRGKQKTHCPKVFHVLTAINASVSWITRHLKNWNDATHCQIDVLFDDPIK